MVHCKVWNLSHIGCNVQYAVGLIGKWSLSLTRLVFWWSSPIYPITMVSEPNSEWVACKVTCGVVGLVEPAVTQLNRDPMQPWPNEDAGLMGVWFLFSIARYGTCPTLVVKCDGVGSIGKWVLSPNRLVFWTSSPVCPITNTTYYNKIITLDNNITYLHTYLF